MVELELKYELKTFPKQLLEKKDEKHDIDIYYDTEDYQLLKNGNFLRLRNSNILEFKLSMNDLTHLYCEEAEFSFPLSLKDTQIVKGILNDIKIETSNMTVLAIIDKTRTVYQIEKNVSIKIDEVKDLGLFLEAEILIDKANISESEIQKNKEKLEKIVLEKLNLKANILRQVTIGYVELYLHKHNQNAYLLGLYQE